MEALPPEILCDIFLRSLPLSFDKFRIPFKASISVPLYISHVCRAWRSLALLYGKLWSYLCINYTTPRVQKKRKALVDIFDTWLSRTNGSPISYVFRCALDEEDNVEDHRRAEYMIKTLLSQQYRWKDVDFAWYDVEFSDKFPGGLYMTNMPTLTSFSLHVDLPVRAAISIAQSSRLKGLDFCGNLDLSVTGEPLRLLSGSRFEFPSYYGYTGSHAVQTCLDFLENAPSIVRFEARFTYDLVSSNRHSHRPRLSMPSLRSLKLDYGEAPATIIDNVTLPCLEALYYASDTEEGIFVDFFRRSRPPLTFLAVHGSCTQEEEMTGILRLLPCLVDLRYSNASVSERFFRELAIQAVEIEENPLFIEHVICPKLETIHLRYLLPLDSITECIEALMYMMRSRERIQKSFGKIYLDLDIGTSAIIDVSNLGRYTEALRQCFEDGDGQLIIGDYTDVLRDSFPPRFSAV
ncbi:hypothetical protein ACEPAH_7598 [Sanghuangporus vaninii]